MSSEQVGIVGQITKITEGKPVYDDLLQPLAKQVGKALGTVGEALNVGLAPLRLMNLMGNQIEAFLRDRLEAKLKHVPHDKILPPPLHVIGPAVEAMRFRMDNETLREMYANLIASSMDPATATAEHPAYVEIIKQLDPRDARLLSTFPLNNRTPIIRFRISTMGYPPSHWEVIPYWMNADGANTAEEKQFTIVTLKNLERLGLINMVHGLRTGRPDEDEIYTKMEQDSFITDAEADKKAEIITTFPQMENNILSDVTRGSLGVTPFGRSFVKVCTR